ncbi:MAG: hypothetical protein E7553_07390 [Ruminococcaceae bacterium]|nr:hypothetical protein [Oscillospiraceae bacterium]
MRRLLCALICVLICVLCTACDNDTAVGVWTALEPSDFYFELMEDGSCMMFDQNDEWVSSGSYIAFENRIEFDTDTGNFVWVWDEETESMMFEAGNGTFHFRKA